MAGNQNVCRMLHHPTSGSQEMRKVSLVLLTAALLTVLAACQKSEEYAAADAAATAEVASAPAAGMAMEASAPAELAKAVGGNAYEADAAVEAQEEPVTAAQMSSSAATYEDGQRKFVRTANASFRVKDVYQSAIAIENIAAGQGGFVVNNQIAAQVERVSRYPIGNAKLLELAEYTVRGNLTVRVPSDKTQDFLRALINQIEFLDQRNFEARDVQFEMLRKQLEFIRNQEAQKQLGTLSTAPGRISDKANVIESQNSARAGRDEAAVLQKEIEDKVAFSTISLSLYQLSKVRKTEIDDVDAVAKNIRPGFFHRLLSSASTGWYGLLDIVVALFAVWPLWLLIALVIVAIRRFRKK
jgi:Domain of unknown function (DUF4349)